MGQPFGAYGSVRRNVGRLWGSKWWKAACTLQSPSPAHLVRSEVSEGKSPASQVCWVSHSPWVEPGLSYGYPRTPAGFPSRRHETTGVTWTVIAPPQLQAGMAGDSP